MPIDTSNFTPSNATTTTLDDGGMDVQFGPDLPNPSEVVNVVPFVKDNKKKSYSSFYNEKEYKNGVDILSEMGDVVVSDYEADLESRKDWEESIAEQVKLFSSFMEQKNWPWEGASNVNLPMLTIAVLQFQSRAYDAIIPPKEIVQALDMQGDSPDKADRVSAYMNYQLLYEMEEFEEGMDKSLMQLPIHGSIFRKSYFDPVIARNKSEYISAMNLVAPYGYNMFEDVPRKTHVLELTTNEVRLRVNSGVFDQDAWDLGPGTTQERSKDILDAIDDTQKTEDKSEVYDKPRVILEQHRNWDLDGDGIGEPFVITVDYETRKVLRITSRTYTDMAGNPKEIEYFTHYVFLPNPEGLYGLGLGTLLRGLNEAANSIVNEVIDAGSLANIQGGFVAKRAGVKKGQLSFKMGEYKEVDSYVDDLSRAIFTFNFKGPNQTLYAVLGLLYEYSKLVSSVSETMTGQLPASDTPATTVMALIEEGRKVFSAIHKRIHRAFKKELRKLFRLNSIFLDNNLYFRVIGPNNLPQGDVLQTGRLDFTDNIDITPISDPMITSRAEKVMKAQTAYQEVMQNPLTNQNQNSIYISFRNYLESLDLPNINEILQPPPEPQPLNPYEENAMIIREQPLQVHPADDDDFHLKALDDLELGPYMSELSAESKRILTQHRKDHLSQMYMKENQPQEEGPIPGNGKGAPDLIGDLV